MRKGDLSCLDYLYNHSVKSPVEGAICICGKNETADVHGYFSELKSALTTLGFFGDTEPHKLIICGDLFDRGSKAVLLQEFILELLEKDQVILIRGNHEDLTLDLLDNWDKYSYLHDFHHSNGTIDTVCQLTGFRSSDLIPYAKTIGQTILQSPFIRKFIPAMVNYYETEHYVFTHGWIPCTKIPISRYIKEYVPIPNWRNADEEAWDDARWINGMEAAHNGIIEADKTIVCGHWHCSFGHCHYENDGGEFDNHPNFNPYYGDGIIALDACTPFSGKVNCILIED